ncbi:MAG: carboxypeptidase-like regulatory domain-containing protein [Candidatus Methanoplasma sp.]|jgi:hypothetical protein|nr:carboxypeptidase-like regulatory domain-containing protein [Candidatus Methanoplasma sp.]
MKGKILLAVIMVALLVSALPIDRTDAEVTAPNYLIEGYVAEGGSIGKIPMGDVTVRIKDMQGTVFEGKTDRDGRFSIEVPANAGLSIAFTAFGYTIISCPNTSTQEGSEYLTLDLTAAAYNSATRTYTITSPTSGMQCAIMAASSGVVKGTVYFGTESIKDVTVTLTPINGEGVHERNTDERGYYEIICPTGTYMLTAGGKGFNDSSEMIVNVTSSPSTANITMEKSELKKYLGLDMAHLLMLVGVIIGILLAAAAWLLGKRMKGPNRLEIFDDSSEEDEDVRYP